MEIKVMSFNIRCCDDINGNSIAERAPRLFEITSKYDADVLGIQEFRPDWEEHFKNNDSKEYGFFHKYRATVDDIESTPILWKLKKFNCLKTGYFWLSDTPEEESVSWDGGCHRICTYVILEDKNTLEKFTFMNTHFGFGDECQVKSVALTARYAKKISDYPTFITGDFNMKPTDAGYTEMVKHFTDANAVTAKDWRMTFHNYNPDVVTDMHIDYCFTDGNCLPLSQKIVDENVGGKYPSDHFGLFTVLKI